MLSKRKYSILYLSLMITTAQMISGKIGTVPETKTTKL